MFSNACEERIKKQYEEFINQYPALQEEIKYHLALCSEEEEILLKYLYATMPLSDAASYDGSVFVDYARQGAFLRKNNVHGRSIPEDLFLNYVVYHRINSEDISPCRSFFYAKVADRIEGMDMKAAALELNYWCQEEATYQSTDDRTASPMTVYNGAFGRCGEESAFTVSVLRSAGIPARQVYAPRWSHCDDNHAWVEVWCDGTWYFLGACEPEEILNKGWFTNASSRAMLIHSRWFDKTAPEEEVIEKDGCATILNQLPRYANTVKLHLHVEDEEGNAVTGAVLDMEILNYSELFPIASLVSDEKGNAALTTGLGSIHIHAYKDGKEAVVLADTRSNTEYRLVLKTEEKAVEPVFREFEVISPVDARINGNMPTQEQVIKGQKRFAAGAEKRQVKTEHFFRKTVASDLQKEFGFSDEIIEILKNSRGNFDSVAAFLSSNLPLAVKEALLRQLTLKDYRDLNAEILKEHASLALAYEKEYPKEIFESALLSPRIYLEPLTSWRKELAEQFGDKKQVYGENPRQAWADICEAVKELPKEEYESLITSPTGCLKVGAGSRLSKKVLFVAVLRSIGIPSRLNPITLEMEYYQNGQFLLVEERREEEGILTLHFPEDTAWVYMQNWSLGVKEEGRYVSLHLEQIAVKEELTLTLKAGEYRLLTSNRLPNGNVFAKSCVFTLYPGKKEDIFLSLKEAKLSDMLENIEIPDFKLFTETGEERQASVLTKNKKNLLVWLEASKEPTEHILNELYERKEEFAKIDAQLLFVIKEKSDLQDPTIARTLKEFPKAKIYYDTFTENVNTLGRRMYVDPDKLPLIIVTDEGLNGVYATSGYNVGTGDMLLRILG